MTLTGTAPADAPEEVPDPRPRPLTVVLVAVIAAAALAAALAIGHVWGRGGSKAVPDGASVDAGFAGDMSTHHQQAVTMAGYTRDTTTSAQIKTLAFDIETSQVFQVGQMQGWLDAWGLPRENPHPMAWMGGHGHLTPDGLMPGMATPEEMARLESANGRALDVLFLQLMIRHHQGGLPMTQYAAAHATQAYVRTLAQAMYTAQSGEIVQMERLLRSMGGTPLPAPEH